MIDVIIMHHVLVTVDPSPIPIGLSRMTDGILFGVKRTPKELERTSRLVPSVFACESLVEIVRGPLIGGWGAPSIVVGPVERVAPITGKLRIHIDVLLSHGLSVSLSEELHPHLLRDIIMQIRPPLPSRIDLPHRVTAAVLVRALLAIGLGGILRDELCGRRVVVTLVTREQGALLRYPA